MAALYRHRRRAPAVQSIGATAFGTGALVGLVAWFAFVVTVLTYVVFGGVVAIWR